MTLEVIDSSRVSARPVDQLTSMSRTCWPGEFVSPIDRQLLSECSKGCKCGTQRRLLPTSSYTLSEKHLSEATYTPFSNLEPWKRQWEPHDAESLHNITIDESVS